MQELPPPQRRPLPDQRWLISPPQPLQAAAFAERFGLSPLLAQVLINRGIETVEQADFFLNPDVQALPAPVDEFPDLNTSVELLYQAISLGEKIAICGDYDADGMTSTALLLRSLRTLGADVDYAIPSRMREGYGINLRIIEEFYQEGISLILTVDNGISAQEPIAKARELGLKVIITDHHDLPPELPPADAILNPKLISETSPYRSLAGVGVAYILALSLAKKMGEVAGLANLLLELFTLGTIADLAPLTGVNRRWVKRGLKLLPHSQLAGVQALIQIAGVAGKIEGNSVNPSLATVKAKNSLKPEDIGFRLGPRINAVGRLADPQIVIELLTTDDLGIALERAMQCEQINRKRQQLCEEIQQEAITWFEQSEVDLQRERVLVVVQPEWHHGVIGIVASRLVERYGVPVFIGTYEEEEEASQAPKIRGSARGIPEFNVFEALLYCDDLLGKYGGHKAAGGFSLPAANLDLFRKRLSEFACQCLKPEYLKPLVTVDVAANFDQINLSLYREIDSLEPCGIENKSPVFWTPNVRVVEQRVVGDKHIKVTLKQESSATSLTAIAWRWRDYFPLPPCVDIAYQLRENQFNGQTSVELELLGVRRPMDSLILPLSPTNQVGFSYQDRLYTCCLSQKGPVKELRIRNPQGKVLAIQQGQKFGLLGFRREEATQVDVSQPFFYHLIQAAKVALGIAEKQ